MATSPKGDRGLHKNTAVLQEKQMVVESKGYRGRLDGVKKAEKRSSVLRRKRSHLPLPHRTVARRSLIKDSSSNQTVCFEIGSDSSEDLFQKTRMVRCVGQKSSSQDGERHAEEQSHSPCRMELREPNDADVVLLDTPDAPGMSEARPGGARAGPGNGDVKENMAVEKKQDVSSPVPCMGRRRGQPVSSSTQEDSSCSSLSLERSQLATETTDPAPNQQAGDKAGMVHMVQPAGSAHLYHCVCENEQEPHRSQASHGSPLSQVSGKKLSQSIQKVNEWFSKSKILSPALLQDVNAEEGDSDLNPFLSDVDCHVFQETEPMGDQWEGAAGCGVGRPVAKPVASRMIDKIFGRTYTRTRKSSRICSEKETVHIPAEGSCTAVTTKSRDTPIRKISARRRATLELTPENVMKKRTAMEDSEEGGGHVNAVLEEDGHGFAVVDGPSGAVQRPAELPVRERASGFELDASPVGCHSHSLQNLKKPRNSLSKRSQRPAKPVCPLPLAMQRSSGTPEKTQAQADGNPSSEGSREGSSDQMHIRRSKRLLSQAAGEYRESEPAHKRRKHLDEGGKKQEETQAGNASSLVVEGGPGVLQVGMAGDASKTCAFPDGSLRVERPTERHSPGHIVPDATSQGSCLLLQCHLAEGGQSDLKVQGFTEVPRAEQSAVCTQAPEGNGSCLRDVKESCRSPKVGDKAIGNGELNPETDDNELDAGFMWRIFHCCKRQSFLLHPSASKKSAAGTQTELSAGQVEGRKADCAKETTPCIASEVGREAVSGSESEHLPVASQAVFPDSSCMPVTVKETKHGNPLQSPKPEGNKKKNSETEQTSNANNCSCGGSGLWRRDNFKCTSLHPADETSSETTRFLEMRPESDRNKDLACSFCSELIQPPPVACQPQSSKSRSGRVEHKSGVGEQKQLKGPGEQSVQISKGNSEQFTEDETPGFTLLSDTPEDLLGPVTKSSLNPWEVDHQGIVAMSAKTDQSSPLQKDPECSSSSSGSTPESLAQACRRQVQKLPSSEEDSSEDEELPCFQALVSGRSASTPLRPTKEEEALAEIPTWRSSSRSSPKSPGEEGSPSQESEGSVTLFSSQSQASEDSSSKPCDTRLLTPLRTSQGKLMAPRTATEALGEISRDAGQLWDGCQGGINADSNLGEALGYDSEVSHLGDSSGFSSQSEILTTQQKQAMQDNLKKLQQEMAVLEAALKERGQDAATEGLPLPREESILPGGQRSSARGGTSQLRCGSRQSLLTASPPAGSMHRTPEDCLTSSSASQEHSRCHLATEPEKGSSVAIQNLSSAPEHESQGRPISSFAATTVCSGRKGNSKSLHSTSERSMFLVASGLFPDERRLVQKFARKTKSTWSNTISKDTTHVIMKTDEDLACERTLKYFLGIAARKWVVSYQWVLQSLKEGRVLNEEDFEVRGDIINGKNHQGPKRARESSSGKLFQGLEICCYGPFTDMKREQLEWMVESCGASLVKQPHLFSSSTNSAKAVVVIQPEAWEEDSGCPGIPPHCSATIVAREWVLDSIACYQRAAFNDYIVQRV